MRDNVILLVEDNPMDVQLTLRALAHVSKSGVDVRESGGRTSAIKRQRV